MNGAKVLEGLVIGGAGGAIAGISVWLANLLGKKVTERRHKKRVHKWLSSKTSDEDGKRYRSTRSIASHNNLTEDRVRFICSTHESIYLSTGEEEDMWGLYGLGRNK